MSKWKNFWDRGWGVITFVILVIPFATLFGLLVRHFTKGFIPNAQKVCVKICKEAGGTHGRLLLPNRDDGFYECRCISVDLPVKERVGSYIIDKE
jgi:hypothetical protein